MFAHTSFLTVVNDACFSVLDAVAPAESTETNVFFVPSAPTRSPSGRQHRLRRRVLVVIHGRRGQTDRPHFVRVLHGVQQFDQGHIEGHLARTAVLWMRDDAGDAVGDLGREFGEIANAMQKPTLDGSAASKLCAPSVTKLSLSPELSLKESVIFLDSCRFTRNAPPSESIVRRSARRRSRAEFILLKQNNVLITYRLAIHGKLCGLAGTPPAIFVLKRKRPMFGP